MCRRLQLDRLDFTCPSRCLLLGDGQTKAAALSAPSHISSAERLITAPMSPMGHNRKSGATAGMSASGGEADVIGDKADIDCRSE